MKINVVFLTAISTLDESFAKNQTAQIEHKLVGPWVKSGICRFADDKAKAAHDKALADEAKPKTKDAAKDAAKDENLV